MIKGTVKIGPISTLKHMQVGDKGYIPIENTVFVGEEEIYISKDALVCSKKDIFEGYKRAEKESPMPGSKEDFLKRFLLVERIGKGLEEDDFIVDVSNAPEMEFMLEEEFIDIQHIPELYIRFRDFQSVVNEKFSRERLTELLDKAVDNNDFEEATRLRDLIEGKK